VIEPTPCHRCGKPKDRDIKKARYCQACFDELRLAQDKTARERKLKPCQRCGGPKDRVARGTRLCQACHEDMQPIWQQRERERSVTKGAAQRRAAGIPQRNKKINADGDVWCARCTSYLPITRFQVLKSGPKAGTPSAYCRRCAKTYAHELRLKNAYGITTEQYENLLRIQDGRCAICRDRPRRYNLAVDHDHQTGKIRGLLCKRCNHDLLGTARDSIEILERAVCYLESPPADTSLPVVIHEDFERDVATIKRIGDRWAVMMDVERLADLIRDAGIRPDDITVIASEPLPPVIAALIRDALEEPA